MSGEGSRGWLHKRGGADAKGGWRKRWCVFVNQAFHYFKTDTDKEPAGTVYAEDIIRVVPNKEESAKDPKFPFVFDIQTEERNYLFCATTSQEGVSASMKFSQIFSWKPANSNALQDAWIANLIAVTTEARQVTLRRGGKEILEYATVELFCERGLRVNGKVSQDVLSVLSQGVTAKQKKTDERGWFCDVLTPAATLLSLMAQHNWSLVNAFNTKTTNSQGTTIIPATMYIFSRQTNNSKPPSLLEMTSNAGRRLSAVPQ